ncbi:hypothetical protein ACP0SI_08440 [Campylobacter coli]|nr:hypothetical protein [Campylobacter coli]EGK8182066.1 hypothetical protein [Campylobacter coli]EKJ5635075.1 hypothetical protein [Campylobacter coli]
MTTYSFIKPKKKPIFTLFDKIWLGLFSFGIFFIFAIYFLYLTKIALTHNLIEEQKEQVLQFQNKTQENGQLYNILLEQSEIANTFYTQNQAFKNSLKNLFDIIVKTDGITLESVEQEKNSLKLIGVTPTKEMFALLLETPLKSIFDQSFTTYYRLNNGWYRFISISKQNSGVLQ